MMVDVIALEDCEILFLNVPRLFQLASSGKGEYSVLIRNLTMISARKNLLLSRRIPPHILQKDPWPPALLSFPSGRITGQPLYRYSPEPSAAC